MKMKCKRLIGIILAAAMLLTLSVAALAEGEIPAEAEATEEVATTENTTAEEETVVISEFSFIVPMPTVGQAFEDVKNVIGEGAAADFTYYVYWTPDKYGEDLSMEDGDVFAADKQYTLVVMIQPDVDTEDDTLTLVDVNADCVTNFDFVMENDDGTWVTVYASGYFEFDEYGDFVQKEAEPAEDWRVSSLAIEKEPVPIVGKKASECSDFGKVMITTAEGDKTEQPAFDVSEYFRIVWIEYDEQEHGDWLYDYDGEAMDEDDTFEEGKYYVAGVYICWEDWDQRISEQPFRFVAVDSLLETYTYGEKTGEGVWDAEPYAVDKYIIGLTVWDAEAVDEEVPQTGVGHRAAAAMLIALAVVSAAAFAAVTVKKSGKAHI